jgi:hypothetical protein
MRAVLVDGIVVELRQLEAGEPLAPFVDITMDGVAQKECTAFDVDEGWIERLKRDADGQYVRCMTAPRMATERVHGTLVVIVQPYRRSDLVPARLMRKVRST